MIDFDNTFGVITLECDLCNTTFEHEGLDGMCDISGAITEAKEYGWLVFKEDGEWYHYCPKECKLIRN